MTQSDFHSQNPKIGNNFANLMVSQINFQFQLKYMFFFITSFHKSYIFFYAFIDNCSLKFLFASKISHHRLPHVEYFLSSEHENTEFINMRKKMRMSSTGYHDPSPTLEIIFRFSCTVESELLVLLLDKLLVGFIEILG